MNIFTVRLQGVDSQNRLKIKADSYEMIGDWVYFYQEDEEDEEDEDEIVAQFQSKFVAYVRTDEALAE